MQAQKTLRPQQKKQQQKKQVNPYIKLCASVGLLSALGLLIAICVVSFLLSLTKQVKKITKIQGFVVQDISETHSPFPTKFATIEFNYNGVQTRRKIYMNGPLNYNDKVDGYVINDDLSNIQNENPQSMRTILISILCILCVLFVITILLYKYYPHLMCGIVAFNFLMIILSSIFSPKKK